MGNVWEQIDADGVRWGGFSGSSESDLASSGRRSGSGATSGYLGFRVVAIPEPVSMVLIGLFGGRLLFVCRIFMK